MRKISLLIFALILIVAVFMIYDSKLEDKSQAIDNNAPINPELLVFHFQPSLKENTEVVINFEKKYLVFKSMYPYSPEPPRSTRKDYEEFIDKRKPIKPYSINLSDKELNYLKNLINSLSDKDFQRIEKSYVDGISYNFSILFSDKVLKNGFIAQNKTENQEKIIVEILRLLHKTNRYTENLEIFKYYSIHN